LSSIYINTNTFAFVTQSSGHRLAMIWHIKAQRWIITSTMNAKNYLGKSK